MNLPKHNRSTLNPTAGTSTLDPKTGTSQKLLALALLAAFAPAHASDEVDALVKPESWISVGIDGVNGSNKDRAFFGQYTGLRKDGGNLLLDFDYIQRDDESGSWKILQGRNLGLDNREFNASYIKQGDWKLGAEYNEITRHDPRSINTGMLNPGSTTPAVTSLAAPGKGYDLNLDLQRQGVTLSMEKWFAPNLQFEASLKNEDKDGARLSGRGIACGVFAAQRNACGAAAGTLLPSTNTAMLMLPEPVNTSTKQIEAKLNYSGQNLMLSGGYYGSFFSNAQGSLNPTVNGNLWNSNGTSFYPPDATLKAFLQQPMALPPDNQAHQFSLAGSYALAPTTRATFKLAYTHATQDRDYTASGLAGAPAGFANLGGEVNSSLAQVGLTARPMTQLSLLANLRYEDKEDNTPLGMYNLTGLATNPANFYTNAQFSSKRLAGKVEANYQLTGNYRAIFGVDYQSLKRDRPVRTTVIDGLSALREDTRETAYRAEVRRSLSETVNGSVAVITADRRGSNWLSVVPGAGFPALSDAAIYNRYGAFPMNLEDRSRDKVKASLNWSPADTVSLQLMLEDGKDTYTAPTEKGLRDTGVRSYGLDLAWKFSDAWKFNGYWSLSKQTLRVDHATGYLASLENLNTAVGFGALGKLSGKFEMGADLSYLSDNNRYEQAMSNGSALLGGGLPDVRYRLTNLKFFGKYALEKDADIRVDLVHQRAKLDEWTWANGGVPFAYSDNSSVTLQTAQNVTYLGARYIYKLK
ncbi:MAG: MtrB/PioB family decaheme-associated outer membrane protein [Rhodocyclaceae bacterium]|nr:MAG: MtrB/PioB family decaheme-associated outer membrane protein [Rhodocyclaceae bacterium]